MSVLVKGMPIPDNCESCAFATGFGFCLAKSDNFCGYTNDRKRPEWCPLVEVSAQPDGIPLEWIDKHLEWLDNCDNDFAQLAKVGIRAMVEIWKKDKT